MLVHDDLFRFPDPDHRVQGQYGTALACKLGHMLQLIEAWLGPRDREWTFLGIEFAPGAPETRCTLLTGKHVIIRLGDNALHDPKTAYFQLAHEAVHLVSPTGGFDSTVMEEALATLFQLNYMMQFFQVDAVRSCTPEYLFAVGVVTRLLAIDANAIKVLRSKEPCISKITAELIRTAFPAVSAEDAARLATPWRDRATILPASVSTPSNVGGQHLPG